MAIDFKFRNFAPHQVKTDETLDGVATENGSDWKRVAWFNWGTVEPEEINDCLHDFVGCMHKTKDGKNYMFKTADSPGVIYIPKVSPTYKLPTDKSYRIQVARPHLRTDIEVESTDEFLEPVGNVVLVLRRQEGGLELTVTTDEHGYARVPKLLSGHYTVLLSDGRPTYFLTDVGRPMPDSITPDDDVGKFVEAVIDTRFSVEAVTQVVVSRTASTVTKQQRRLIHAEYRRAKATMSLATFKGPEPLNAVVSQLEAAPDKETRTRPFIWAIDNLAFAAGWKTQDEIDIQKLTSSVIAGFLDDRHQTIRHRGYYVWVMEPLASSPKMTLYNSQGNEEVSVSLTHSVVGLAGVYTGLESRQGVLLADVATNSYYMVVDGTPGTIVPIAELAGEERQKVIDGNNAHAGQVQLAYLLCPSGMMKAVGRHGGCGYLENYGENSIGVHERNLAVCRTLARLYNEYAKSYVGKVKETKNEKELRKLRAPWSPYVMPVPEGATESQRDDILDAQNFEWFTPWRAINEQLDKFSTDKFGGRPTEGFPFMSLKFKWVVHSGKKPEEKEGEGGEEKGEGEGDASGGGLDDFATHPIGAIEIEGQMLLQVTDDEIRPMAGYELQGVLEKEDEVSIKDHKYELGIEYKRNLKEPGWETTIRTGPLELEFNQEGKAKIAMEALPGLWSEAEYQPSEARFEGGLKIVTKDVIKVLKKLPFKDATLGKWISRFEDKMPTEISVHFGMMGAREESLMAMVSGAPGFFDRRSLEELVETKWDALWISEETQLSNLGWDQLSWDLKAYEGAKRPETMQKESWSKFTTKEKIALINLGFYNVKEYHEVIEECSGGKKGWADAISKMVPRVAPYLKKGSEKKGEEGEGDSTSGAEGTDDSGDEKGKPSNSGGE